MDPFDELDELDLEELVGDIGIEDVCPSLLDIPVVREAVESAGRGYDESFEIIAYHLRRYIIANLPEVENTLLSIIGEDEDVNLSEVDPVDAVRTWFMVITGFSLD